MNKEDVINLVSLLLFSISILINTQRIWELKKEIEQIKETNIVCEVEKDV